MSPALPPSQQMGLSGFDTVGLQGNVNVSLSQEPNRPNVPMSVVVIAKHSCGRSQSRIQGRSDVAC